MKNLTGWIILTIFLYLLWWPIGILATILLVVKYRKASKTTYKITDETGKTYTVTKEEQ
jgi:hypothetical protein